MLIIPVLLSFTLLADRLDMLYCIFLFATIGLMICSERVSPVRIPLFCKEMLEVPMQGKRPFITSFRAYVNIAGAISILAVDFQVFPRRFAKAETYGTGLMDVGVGAYVISNAIVSAEARGKYPPCRYIMFQFLGHHNFQNFPQFQETRTFYVCTSKDMHTFLS